MKQERKNSKRARERPKFKKVKKLKTLTVFFSGGDFLSLDRRPFLKSVFDSLDPIENDYLSLFALCLIFAIQQNSGKET